jgi:hypothetical protein
MEDESAFSAKPRLRALLDHFGKIKDTRQAWHRPQGNACRPLPLNP